jgi:hypothetical protein
VRPLEIHRGLATALCPTGVNAPWGVKEQPSAAKAEYFAVHGRVIQDALSRAVNAAVQEQASDPLVVIARMLLNESGVADSGNSRSDASSHHGWTARAWMASVGVASSIVDALLDGPDDGIQANMVDNGV